MRTDPIHLIGAGGHGLVVADALLAASVDAATIVMRDGRSGLTMLGRAVLTPEVTETMAGQRFHVTVGAPAIRARLHSAALAADATPMTVIHPAAVVSTHATLEDAVLVAATAVIAPAAHIGTSTIVNHAAVVDHEVRIGAFCHVSPNATLGGGVSLGDRVMVGAGAVVLPGLSIASDVTIGAGAVVLRSIGEAGIWIGNPARRLAR